VTVEPREAGGQVLVYEAPGGEMKVDVRLERETVWLSRRQMAELFDTSTDNISLHLKNIFSQGELAEEATTEDYSVVRTAESDSGHKDLMIRLVLNLLGDGPR